MKMKTFWIRAVNIMAIVAILLGYNIVLDVRAKDEQIAKLNAELETLKLTQEREAQETEGIYKDGVYSGEAEGFGGMISLEVTVENEMISKIEIVSADKEDGAYLAMAEDIIPSIIESQSAEVDTISGATFSSTGIKNAAIEALKKAEK